MKWFNKRLPMSGFEPVNSSYGSDRCASQLCRNCCPTPHSYFTDSNDKIGIKLNVVEMNMHVRKYVYDKNMKAFNNRDCSFTLKENDV